MGTINIVGCGSLGKRIAKWWLNYWDVEFYDDFLEAGSIVDGWLIKGSVNDLIPLGGTAIVAIGNSVDRRAIYTRLKDAGFNLLSVMHPTALVQTQNIGSGAIIKQRAIIDINVSVGEDTIIGVGNIIGHDSKIGCHCNLGPGLSTGGYVEIGDNCTIGVGVSIDRGVSIGENSIVGSGCTLWKSHLHNSFIKLPAPMVVQERS